MPDFAALQAIDAAVNPAPAPAAASVQSAPDYSAVIDVGGSKGASPGMAGSQLMATGSGSDVGTGGSAPQSFEQSPLGQKLAAADAAKDQAPAAAPSGKSGKKTGILANIGAGTSEGVADTLGAPVDLATGLMNLPARGINAVAGTHIPTIDNPVGGSEWWKSAEGLAGADPRNVEPANAGQQLLRAGARGAVNVALPGAAIGALPAAAGVLGAVQEGLASGAGTGGAVAGAGGAVTGQVASDVVPDRYKPLADFLGNVAGGGVVAGGEAAMTGAGRAAASAGRSIADPLGFGVKQTIVDPTNPGATVTGTAGQLRTAGRSMAGGMGMAPVDAAASIPSDVSLVPGSTSTIGQATGNVDALNYERKLQTTPAGRPLFTAADAANNTARAAALQGLAPADAATAASGYLRGQFARMQAADAADIAGKQASAEGAVAALPGAPGSTSVQTLGGEQRAALVAHQKPVKAAAGRAFDAIDPDGTLALDVSKVGEMGRELAGSVNERMGGHVAAVEAPILRAAEGLRGVELFSDLRTMLKNVSAAQRAIRKDLSLGAESEPFRRMTMLRGAIEDAMAEAVEKQAEHEQQSVNAGAMAPEHGILVRLHAASEDHAGIGASRRADDGGVQQNAGDAGGVSARAGKQVSAGAGRGNAGGDRGVSDGAADAVAPLRGSNRKAETLHDFVISKGGVKDQSGEYTAQDLDRIHHRAGGRLINPNGISEDYMREAAVQEGFLPANADINDFRDAMMSDKPVHRISETEDARARTRDSTQAWQEDEERYNSRDAVATAADDAGVRLSKAELDHATELHMRGAHADDAMRQAVSANEDATFQRNAERNAVGHPGLPPGATQTDLGIAGKPGLTPNFNQEAADRLRAANSMYARYKNTFRNGAVGDVLATGSAADGFRLSNSDVPGRLFRGGVKGAEAADSLIKATGSPEAAASLLGDYPAFSLRTAAERDGALDLKAYDRWMKQHSAVLDKFPAMRAQFETAADAQRVVDTAAARHVARMEAMQDSAARFYLDKEGGAKDVQTAITKLMSSENPAAEAASLMRMVGNDRMAADGVRRNVADWLIAKARSTAESGTTGEKEIAAGTFQKLIADPKTARALASVFDTDQMQMIRAIGKDLERAARSVNAVRIKGSPGTAADLAAAGGHGDVSQLMQMELTEKLAEGAAHVVGASGILGSVSGSAGAVASVIYNKMRAAGLHKVDEIAALGMLNPELGRLLMQRAVTDPEAPILGALGRRMAAVTMGASADMERE